MEQLGCPFVAVNLAVGLSLSMPSIATQIAGEQAVSKQCCQPLVSHMSVHEV